MTGGTVHLPGCLLKAAAGPGGCFPFVSLFGPPESKVGTCQTHIKDGGDAKYAAKDWADEIEPAQIMVVQEDHRGNGSQGSAVDSSFAAIWSVPIRKSERIWFS